jgi:8-oxo-dGTP pyrophosphatase MutT (NUDIX family)
MPKIIDKIGWLLVKDHKVLVVRSRGKYTFYTPGGKRESGESDEQALVREIREELGVELAPETIRYLETFEAQAHGKPEGVNVSIKNYSAEYSGTLTPTSEIEELAWFTSADTERTSPTGQLSLEWLKKQGLID